MTTSAVDDHQTQLGVTTAKNEEEITATTSAPPGTPHHAAPVHSTNKRNHKRTSVPPSAATPSDKREDLFNVGAKTVVPFTKAGALSPKKDGEAAVVGGRAKRPVRPARGRRSLFVEEENKKEVSSPSKVTPAQFKAEMGTVRKLSDLQQRLKAITDVGKVNKASLVSPKKSAPSLSTEAVTFEIRSPVKSGVKKAPVEKSPVKASPRKALFAEDKPKMTDEVDC